MLFEVTKLRIWKQFTTQVQTHVSKYCCLRSQSYEFESNSQRDEATQKILHGCLRSQSYEFESNSQLELESTVVSTCCLRSQSYEFESNSQQESLSPLWIMVVWDHKVTNLKATHNVAGNTPIQTEVVWGHKVTNLKATHNSAPRCVCLLKLFEITKLRIWKQLTTLKRTESSPNCCLRSQSYEFESNSQLCYLLVILLFCCLRSQSYEFKSNSQLMWGYIAE